MCVFFFFFPFFFNASDWPVLFSQLSANRSAGRTVVGPRKTWPPFAFRDETNRPSQAIKVARFCKHLLQQQRHTGLVETAPSPKTINGRPATPCRPFSCPP